MGTIQPSRGQYSRLVAAAAVLILASEAAFGQPVERPDWATAARIDSVYEAPSGQRIRAVVDFKNDRGTYTLLYSAPIVGTLSEIQYAPNFSHQLGPRTAALFGRWSLMNMTGYFVFREPTKEGLVDGYWGYQLADGRLGPVAGSWDGIIQVPVSPPAAEAPQRAVAMPDLPPGIGDEVASAFAELPTGEEALNPDGTVRRFIPEEWLQKASRVVPAVGQVIAKDGTPFGTCFMVGDGVALSAKHVIDAMPNAEGAEVRFQISNTPRFDYFKMASQPLTCNPDACVILLSKDPNQDWPPAIQLPAPTTERRRFKYRNAAIIHYPGAMGRQLSFLGEFLDPERTHGYAYTVDTDKGSSGAPVFDFDWNLVAVHWGGGRTGDPDKMKLINLGYRIESVLLALRENLSTTEDGRAVLAELKIPAVSTPGR